MTIDQSGQQFADYRLSGEIKEALKLLGYQTPTTIQQQVIPQLLAGRHVVAKAQTGSGKTAAFAIPVCETVMWNENSPQALILEPTRELTVQVQTEVFHIGRKKRLKVPALFGGFPIDKQIQTLRQKSHIVTGTPGRVLDHLQRGSLKLDKVAFLVIDEADLMLDMGFVDEIMEIISYLPQSCNMSLFSATLRAEIQAIAATRMKDAVFLMPPEDQITLPAITEKLYEGESDDKFELLVQVLIAENPECGIIFCGTREMVTVLFQKLRRHRIFCGMIHGELDQKERLKTISAFRNGGFRFLIATDVAARGIDLEHITHVLNYDFPTGKETYVHRIGRTGRNGKTGTAISFVSQADQRMLAAVEEYIGRSLPVLEKPVKEEQKEKKFWQSQRLKAERKPTKEAALNRDILRLSIGGGRRSKMRAGDIVGSICALTGLEATDIGIIDIRESLTYVEILNQKGNQVLEQLQSQPIKGKLRKVRKTSRH